MIGIKKLPILLLTAITKQAPMGKTALLNALIYLAVFFILLIAVLVYVALYDRNK